MSEEKIKKRPSWDEYFMNIAQMVATRSTCNRGVDLKYMPGFKGVGAIIVKDKVILSTGYNGSPRGLDHCDDVGHEIVEGHCIRTVHAEANALVQAAKSGVSVDGADLYTTASPCYDCFKMIINAGIKRVVCGSYYGSRYGASEKVLTLASQAGIKLEFLRDYRPDDTIKLFSEENYSFKEAGEKESIKENSSDLKVKVKRFLPEAKIPSYARINDAGLDLAAIESIEIPAGSRAKIGTGLSFEIPDGYVGLIWDRSGLSAKKGLKVLGGVVDSNYRGEVFVTLANVSREPAEILKGERIAQMLIQKIEKVEILETDELSETERGDQGYGSSDSFEGEIPEEIIEEEPILEDEILDESSSSFQANKKEKDEIKSRW